MHKTKQQKQAEALARKRAYFPTHLAYYCDAQPGGTIYERLKAMNGEAMAQANAQNAERYLQRMAAEAQVDRNGNPL